MENGAVYLKKGEGRSMKAGGPWVYDNEVERIEGEPLDGDVVSVHDYNGFCLGKGFLNRRSKLRVRMLTRNRNQEIDEDFLRMRVENAWEYRKKVVDPSSCRLVFGEADQLPGLTVDRFGDVLSVQVLSLGMERHKKEFLDGLIEVLRERQLAVSCVYERNDVKIRELEGMQQYKGFYRSSLLDPAAEKTRVDIVGNGIRYTVDVENGQKTGFFLDQKFNRLAAAQIGKGRHVLDCFTHTGAFALNIAKGGAASVTALDISKEAVEMTAHNAKQNGLAVEAVEADVFDFLTELDKKKDHSYDYIVLDPPAFTKSGKTVHEAFRGYKEINYRAMKILPRGGYLATCSCSHFMGEELFVKMVKEAARDAGVTLRQIEFRQQAPDHPILMTVPETYYLKFFLFQIV